MLPIWVSSGVAASSASGGAAGIAVPSDGSAVYWSEPGLNRVSSASLLSPGVWSARVTVAGNGTVGGGAEGQATAAIITAPGQLAIVNDTLLYFIEGASGSYHVRRLDLTTGWLATLVGGSTASVPLSTTAATTMLPAGGASATLTGAQTVYSGAGTAVGSATASLGGIAADAAGNVFFTDGNRLRQLWPNGSAITTLYNLAGATASAGDGGPALSASGLVGALALTPSGLLLFTEPITHRVRALGPAVCGSTAVPAGFVVSAWAPRTTGYSATIALAGVVPNFPSCLFSATSATPPANQAAAALVTFGARYANAAAPLAAPFGAFVPCATVSLANVSGAQAPGCICR